MAIRGRFCFRAVARKNRNAPFVFTVLCAQLAFCLPVHAAGVTVTSSKSEYAQEEPVQLTVTNDSGAPVRTLARSPDPGLAVRNLEVRNPRGIWDAFFLENRKAPDEVFDRAGELAQGESVSFYWLPMVLEKGKRQPPGPGLYRITVIYHIDRPGKPRIFGTAKSNEFEIK